MESGNRWSTVPDTPAGEARLRNAVILAELRVLRQMPEGQGGPDRTVNRGAVRREPEITDFSRKTGESGSRKATSGTTKIESTERIAKETGVNLVEDPHL